jgi:hypothetical protein
LAVYLFITYFYRQNPQFSERASPIEKSFCVTEYAITNSCTSVQRSSENGFIRLQLLQLGHIGGLTTLKARDASVRKKAVAVFV